MESISTRAARRLALCRAGLLKPSWTGMPAKASGSGLRARVAALRIIQRFGYLQLDTVSIAGARSHAIVLMSRLEGFDPALAEDLLQPGEPLFEYWGHEASWLPIELYPLFAFRRDEFQHHPWWGDVISENPKAAEDLIARIRIEGPLRSLDMDGAGSSGWWDLKVTKKVATALWSTGRLAIRERRNFQRTYDLAERVIPEVWRQRAEPKCRAFVLLLLKALDGHGWATTATLAQTWRLRNARDDLLQALEQLVQEGEVIPCELCAGKGQTRAGWIRPADLELAARLERSRPRRDRGILLSPFDPVLWDRGRVDLLFKFHQLLEIYKPSRQRIYGYYCLPVLAGDRLVARYDLKADRKKGRLAVLAQHFEEPPTVLNREAARTALERFADTVQLAVG